MLASLLAPPSAAALPVSLLLGKLGAVEGLLRGSIRVSQLLPVVKPLEGSFWWRYGENLGCCARTGPHSKEGMWAALGRGSGEKGAISCLLSDIQSQVGGGWIQLSCRAGSPGFADGSVLCGGTRGEKTNKLLRTCDSSLAFSPRPNPAPSTPMEQGQRFWAAKCSEPVVGLVWE